MAVGSFSSALSGLNAHQSYLSVIGNNLSNINTVGYKTSVISFADLMSQTAGGTSVNPMQIGLGVVTGSISPVFSQGPVETTRETSNAAIQGNGFFIVRDQNGATAYTRAGNFSFNADGELVTPDGWKVQGYSQVDPATGQIVTTGGLADIVVPPGVLRPPVATTNITAQINLNAEAEVGGTPFVTPVKIYDQLGSPHVVTLEFQKTGAGQWTYTATVPQSEVTAGGTGVFTLATGTLSFDGSGTLIAPAADITLTAPATWANGATGVNMTWDIIGPAGTAPTITSFSSPSETGALTQNGAAAGQVTGVSIDPEGRILATFGGGQSVAVAQLGLANFNNPKGLMKLGGNRYGESQSAGAANIGTAGTGGRGTVIGSAIEQSNVDIAQEFTNMIIAQRGYQANSRTITVSDEVLVETLNMKR